MSHEINVFILVVYLVVVYGGESCHFLDFTEAGYLLHERYEEYMSLTVTGVVVIMHCILLGWLADSYFGRYQVFVLTLIFMTVQLLAATVSIVGTVPLKIKGYLFLTTKLFDGIYLTFSGLIYIILLEQFHLPEDIHTIRKYTFYYYEIFLIATFTNETFSYSESYELTLGKFIFTAIILGIISVITMKFHKLIHVEPVYFRIIENCLQAVYFAISSRFKKRDTTEESTSARHTRHGHWIYRAQYMFPDVILESTKQFLHQILLLTFNGIFACFFSLNVSTMSIQANLIGRTFHANLNLSLSSFLKILVILCLPVTEFIIIPMMRACTMFKRDLHYIGIGFFFLFMSTVYSTYLQISLQRHIFALPERDSGQLRIYNALPEGVNLITQHNETLEIKPYGLLSILRLYGVGRISRQFSLQSSIINQTRYLSTHSGQSFTAVITKTGISLAHMPDSLFHYMLKTNISNFMFTIVLLVHREFVDGYITFAAHKGEFYMLHVNPTIYQPFVLIRAGKYHVTYRDNMYQRLQKLDTKAEFTVGGIYSLFVYRNSTGDLTAKIFTVMHPIVIHWKYLLPQVMFSALAQCFTTISWMKFTFTEAPLKLRTASFCYRIICIEIFTTVISLESHLLESIHYADKLYLSIGFLLSSWVLFMYVAANYKYVEWKPKQLVVVNKVNDY